MSSCTINEANIITRIFYYGIGEDLLLRLTDNGLTILTILINERIINEENPDN